MCSHHRQVQREGSNERPVGIVGSCRVAAFPEIWGDTEYPTLAGLGLFFLFEGWIHGTYSCVPPVDKALDVAPVSAMERQDWITEREGHHWTNHSSGGWSLCPEGRAPTESLRRPPRHQVNCEQRAPLQYKRRIVRLCKQPTAAGNLLGKETRKRRIAAGSRRRERADSEWDCPSRPRRRELSKNGGYESNLGPARQWPRVSSSFFSAVGLWLSRDGNQNVLTAGKRLRCWLRSTPYLVFDRFFSVTLSMSKQTAFPVLCLILRTPYQCAEPKGSSSGRCMGISWKISAWSIVQRLDPENDLQRGMDASHHRNWHISYTSPQNMLHRLRVTQYSISQQNLGNALAWLSSFQTGAGSETSGEKYDPVGGALQPGARSMPTSEAQVLTPGSRCRDMHKPVCCQNLPRLELALAAHLQNTVRCRCP